jgi:hypothetical protein
MPTVKYCSIVAITRIVIPILDLDLSAFTNALAFLINTDCITMEIRIIRPKTKMSALGNMLSRDNAKVLPNDLSITCRIITIITAIAISRLLSILCNMWNRRFIYIDPLQETYLNNSH